MLRFQWPRNKCGRFGYFFDLDFTVEFKHFRFAFDNDWPFFFSIFVTCSSPPAVIAPKQTNRLDDYGGLGGSSQNAGTYVPILFFDVVPSQLSLCRRHRHRPFNSNPYNQRSTSRKLQCHICMRWAKTNNRNR